MTGKAIKDIVASVRGRLLNLARRTGKPYNEIVIQYALERFLFRRSKSSFKGQFLLKGGLLLMGRWLPQARPTRDIDLLGLMTKDLDVAEIRCHILHCELISFSFCKIFRSFLALAFTSLTKM